jgi:hypothetical protein
MDLVSFKIWRKKRMKGMKRIRIVSVPEGPDIPEEIRKEWVGVEFEAEGPVIMEVQSLLTPIESHGLHLVYKVPADVALQALRRQSEKAWEWFSKRVTAPVFCFDKKSCQLVIYRRYTLADVEVNIQSVVGVMEKEKIDDVVGLLELNHTLWYWVEAHHMLEKIHNLQDIKLVEPFWNLSECYGIKLTDEQKAEIFQNFIED